LTEKDKFRPAFKYPPDLDGKTRAQEVASDGYPANVTVEYAVFEKEIPEQKKALSQRKKVLNLNKLFKFSFK